MIPSEADLLACLDQLGIAHATLRHPAVFTVSESDALYERLPGGHFKTLLVVDRRGHMALVALDAHDRLDVKAVARAAGLGRPSFASADLLWQTLGLKPGSVSPFALLGCPASSAAGQRLTVILDPAVLAADPVNFHPLHNEATTAISAADLLTFVRHCGYDPIVAPVARQDDA